MNSRSSWFFMWVCGIFFIHWLSLFGEDVKESYHKDFKKGLVEYLSKSYDVYDKISQDSPTIKSSAREFFEEYDKFQLKDSKARSALELCQMARDLRKTRDPFLKCLIGHVLRVHGSNLTSDETRALEQFKKARHTIFRSKYPPEEKLRSYRRFIQMVYDFDWYYKRIHKQTENYKLLVLEWLESSLFKESDLRYVWWELSYFFNAILVHPQYMEEVLQKVESKKGFSPWLLSMIKGKTIIAKMSANDDYYHERSYYYRLRNKSDLRRQLKASIRHFEKAYDLKPDIPEAAVAMINVSKLLGGSDPDLWEWFDKCIQIEIDHPEAYREMIMALKPSYGGSSDEVINLGVQCMESELYETYTPSYLFDAAYAVGVTTLKKHNVYEKCKRVVETYLKSEAPLPGLTSKNLYSFLIALAQRVGNDQEVVRLHRLSGDDLDLEPARKFHVHREFIKNILFAHAKESPFRELAIKLNNTISMNNPRSLEVVKKLYDETQEALEEVDDKQVIRFFDLYIVHLRQEMNYAEGGWIDLSFDDQMLLWHNSGGDFKTADDYMLYCGKNKGDQLYFYTRSWFEPPYSLEVTIHYVSTPNYNGWMQSGFISGRMQSGNRDGRMFWADGWRGRTGVLKSGESPHGVNIKKAGAYKLKAEVWKGYYNFYVNNKLMYNGKSKDFVPGHIGVGMIPNRRTQAGRVSFERLRIRKMPGGERPDPGDYKAMAEYYVKMLEVEESELLYERAVTYLYDSRDYFKSLEYAYEMLEKYPRNYVSTMIIGSNLWVLGDYETAFKNIEAVYKRKNNHNKYIRGQYAYMLACCEDSSYIDKEKALRLAKEVNDMTDYKKAYYLSVLGHACAINGKFDEALKWMRQSIELEKDQEDIDERKEYIELFKQKKRYVYRPDENKYLKDLKAD